MAGKRRRSRRAKSGRKKKGTVQENLIKALNHPLRVTLMKILSERTASPKEIADHLDVELSNVSYHMRVLEELGFAAIVEEERVRGSVAHFYRSTQPQLIDNQAWASLDGNVRNAASGQLLERFITDAAAALSSSRLDGEGDPRLAHIPLVLDNEGWRKVLEIQSKAVESVQREQAAATLRMDGGEVPTICAILGIFCFEADPSEQDQK